MPLFLLPQEGRSVVDVLLKGRPGGKVGGGPEDLAEVALITPNELEKVTPLAAPLVVTRVRLSPLYAQHGTSVLLLALVRQPL
jgi:hypothetical protein